MAVKRPGSRERSRFRAGQASRTRCAGAAAGRVVRGSGYLAGHAPAMETGPDRTRGCSACTPHRPRRPPVARWAGITAGIRRIPSAWSLRHLSSTITRPWSRPSPSRAAAFWLLTPLLHGRRPRHPRQPRLRPRRAPARPPATRRASRQGIPAPRCPAARCSWSACCASSEQGRAVQRANKPPENRWYSRDVAAIAAARGLPATLTAPFFVDAAAGQNPAGSPDQPQGGLTVVGFHNNHLVYALTWYALALMVAGASVVGSR